MSNSQQERDLQALRDSLAREAFDCGYAQCGHIQRGVIDRQVASREQQEQRMREFSEAMWRAPLVEHMDLIRKFVADEASHTQQAPEPRDDKVHGDYAGSRVDCTHCWHRISDTLENCCWCGEGKTAAQQAPEPRRSAAEEYVRKQLVIMDGSAEAGIARIGPERYERCIREVEASIPNAVPPAQQAEAGAWDLRPVEHWAKSAIIRELYRLRGEFAALKSSQQEEMASMHKSVSEQAYALGYQNGQGAHLAEQAKAQEGMETKLLEASNATYKAACQMVISTADRFGVKVKGTESSVATAAHNLCVLYERKLAAAEQTILTSQAALIRKCAEGIGCWSHGQSKNDGGGDAT